MLGRTITFSRTGVYGGVCAAFEFVYSRMRQVNDTPRKRWLLRNLPAQTYWFPIRGTRSGRMRCHGWPKYRYFDEDNFFPRRPNYPLGSFIQVAAGAGGPR